MPQRSIKGLASEFGIKEKNLTEQASTNGWTGRAVAWDSELDRRIREHEVTELQKMRAQQIKIASGLQLVGAAELAALQRKQAQADKVAADNKFVREPLLKSRDIVQLIEAGSRLERLNRGEPTSNDVHTVKVGEAPEAEANEKGSTRGLAPEMVEIIRTKILKGSAS